MIAIGGMKKIASGPSVGRPERVARRVEAVQQHVDDAHHDEGPQDALEPRALALPEHVGSAFAHEQGPLEDAAGLLWSLSVTDRGSGSGGSPYVAGPPPGNRSFGPVRGTVGAQRSAARIRTFGCLR